jgi:hypothetical protein
MKDHSVTFHLRKDLVIYNSSLFDEVEELAKAGPESDFWKKMRAEHSKGEWAAILESGKSRGLFPNAWQ